MNEIAARKSLGFLAAESTTRDVRLPGESDFALRQQVAAFGASSAPIDILGPRKHLSGEEKNLKTKILEVILANPEGIDTYDLATKVRSDMGTVNMLCQELEKEAKITRG